MTNLTPDRAAHMRGVALFMYRHASECGLDPLEAALCGWLHDFGYIAGGNRDHAHIAGVLLERVGYAHAGEVSSHGSLAGLSTPMGVLLNIADMSVDSHGVEVGFEQRLRDVAARYGGTSPQYVECARMVGALRRTREWSAVDAGR